MVKTTVIGNYPKIPGFGEGKLRKALHEFDKGSLTKDQLEMVSRQVTQECLAEQELAGIDLVTDGQMRWQDEVTYLMGGLAGVQLNGLVRFFDTNTYYRTPIIEGRLAYRKPALTSDYVLAKENSKREVKAVLTGAYTLGRLCSNKFYPEGGEEIYFDIAKTLNQEIRSLVEAGARHVQINEPYITYSQDWQAKDLVLGLFDKAFEGIHAKKWLVTYLGDHEAIGEFSQRADFVGLDFVEGKRNLQLLKQANLRQGCGLCLGLVNARNTNTEKFGDVREIIGAAMAKAGGENVYLSPNTGLDYLPREKAQAKMKLLVSFCQEANKLALK